MKLPKIDIKDICFKYNRDFRKLPSGICSVFMPLNKTWGIKSYVYKHTAVRALNIQKRAYKLGVGPQCGSLFKFYVEGDTIWAFVTRVAKKVNCRISYDHTKSRLIARGKYAAEHDQLYFKLKNNRLPCWDLHVGNVGLINGRLVCIDFVAD